MKAATLFSGIGGFDLPLQRKGVELVEAVEIDKYARSVYSRHFPGVRLWQDATKIEPERLSEFDILACGPPCQSFSVAGNRRGFADTRGTLFYEVFRIAKEKQPSIIIIENVLGLLNIDSGETFRTILKALDEVGYDAAWQVLNSKFFVPQNRERVFIIGHLRGKRTRKIFPIGGTNPKSNGKNLMQVGNIDQKGHNSIWGRVYSPDGISSTINAQGGGLGAKSGLYAVPKIKRIEGKPNIYNTDAQGGKIYDPEGISPTVSGQRVNSQGYIAISSGQAHAISKRIRRLTPMECERLQGFPDEWTKYGRDGELISDTQRYKMCGNAVTVPVVEYILEALLK